MYKKSESIQACLDIYGYYFEKELPALPEPVQKAWKLGEIYCQERFDRLFPNFEIVNGEMRKKVVSGE